MFESCRPDSIGLPLPPRSSANAAFVVDDGNGLSGLAGKSAEEMAALYGCDIRNVPRE